MWMTRTPPSCGYSEEAITRTVAHELLHTLGFAQHVDPERFKDASILNVDDPNRQRIVRTS